MSGTVQERLEVLRELLTDGDLSTQEELREKLEKRDFDVTQSTVSRDLRKLGAIRAVDPNGRTVYKLPEDYEPPLASRGLPQLVREVTTNGSMIVIHTAAGSASLIARQVDAISPTQILGTIAGDDTIFVAPADTSPRALKGTIKAIHNALAIE